MLPYRKKKICYSEQERESGKYDGPQKEVSKVESIKLKIDKHYKIIEKLLVQLKAEREKLTLICFYCSEITPIKELTFIQHHWYERPYGCTGGDYWTMSKDGSFNCIKCNKINRFLPQNEDEEKELFELKKSFKAIENIYRN